MGRQDANLLRLDLEDFRHIAAHAERALRGGVERVATAGGIVEADRGPRLHCVDDHAAVDDLELRHVGGLGESGRDLLAVAVVVVERDIARRLGMDQRRAGARGFLRPHHGG